MRNSWFVDRGTVRVAKTVAAALSFRCDHRGDGLLQSRITQIIAFVRYRCPAFIPGETYFPVQEPPTNEKAGLTADRFEPGTACDAKVADFLAGTGSRKAIQMIPGIFLAVGWLSCQLGA